VQTVETKRVGALMVKMLWVPSVGEPMQRLANAHSGWEAEAMSVER
jgi:hypothetical protein